jgi:predicted nucleic acid-binding protein
MVCDGGDTALERTKAAVADASVIARWYVREESYKKALEVRKDYEEKRLSLVEPSLLPYEIFNALRYSPELGMEDVKDSVRSMVDMQLDLREMDQEWARLCVESAYKYGLSIYDSAYLTLAQRLRIKLVTADGKLSRKLPKDNLVMLNDYALKIL